MGQSSSKVSEKDWLDALATATNVKSVKDKILADKDFNQLCRETVAHSFAGNKTSEAEPTLNWMFGPEVEDRAANQEERDRLLYFCMMFSLYENGLFPKMGNVLHLTDEEGELAFVETGNFNVRPKQWDKSALGESKHKVPAAYTIIRLFPTGFRQEFGETSWWQMKIMSKFGGAVPSLPQMWTDKGKKEQSEQFKKRSKVLKDSLHTEHLRLFKGKPHMYVNVVCVSPNAQGQGACGKLMRAINEVADKLGLPCYLECTGERRKQLYSRYGYEMSVELTMTFDGDDQATWPALTNCYGMTRPAQSEIAEIGTATVATTASAEEEGKV